MTEDFINFNSKAKIKDIVEIIIKDTKDKSDYLEKMCTKDKIGPDSKYEMW